MTDALEVIYHDAAIVAVHKPSGLAVHRGLATDDSFALDQTRDLVGHRVYPVHRLDRGTSGVLIFGCDSTSAHALARQFEAHHVYKRYLALVRGWPATSGVINHPIPRAEGGPRVPAVTHFRRLATWQRYAWVEAIPQTGRMHQIRRHFKHLSHPLIGDVKYGKGEHNRYFRETFSLHRLALHAFELALAHPETGQWLRLQAPPPADLAATIEAMNLTLRLQQSMLQPMLPIELVPENEYRIWKDPQA